MPKKPSKRDTVRTPLRRQAVARWQQSHAEPSPQASAETVQNLEVHQIELEIQNEELHQTQEELIRARDRYRDLYDFTPVGCLMLDMHRVIRQANLTAATMLGVERGKLLGMRMERFASKESRDALYLHLQGVLKSPIGRSCSVTLQRKDGSPFYARIDCTTTGPPFDEGAHYRVTLSDITSLHDATEALEKSERKFRALTEKAADYITVLDTTGIIVYENPSAKRELGFAAGELVGRSGFDLVHADDRPVVERAFAELLRRPAESVEIESRVRARDGSWRWLQVVGTNLLDDPAVRGIVLNSRDVTERKQAVEDLQRLNEALDQRVRERTEAIQVIHDIASVANSAQDVKQALEYCLLRLTDYNGWRFGHALLPAADAGGLALARYCYPEGSRQFERFREVTAGMAFHGAEGLPGRALAARKPVWTTQLQCDLCEPRATLAAELGLKTGVAIAVLVGERVAAVLELFSDKAISADEQFTEVMASVGMQLGRVVERSTFEERLLAVADDVQQRIAQDLHDDLGQELTGLGLKAETLVERLGLVEALGSNDVRTARLAADVMAAIETARTKVRALARRILPVEIELGSLPGALEGLAAATTAGSHAACKFRNLHPPIVFDGRVATHLFRIAQESVSNAIRHGEPRNIRIDLAKEKGHTVLRIEDDGAGLPAGESGAEGLGLRIMRYRAGLIGGTLEIGPAAPRGTVVRCHIVPDGSETSTPSRRRRR